MITPLLLLSISSFIVKFTVPALKINGRRVDVIRHVHISTAIRQINQPADPMAPTRIDLNARAARA